MTITYHSVQYYVKDGDTWTGKAGFTNDPALFEQHLNNTAAEFHQGMKYAWSARDDPDDTTKADDLEAYKRKLGNDAEETAPGYWPTRGSKSSMSELGIVKRVNTD
jgi:hypothetical protein